MHYPATHTKSIEQTTYGKAQVIVCYDPEFNIYEIEHIQPLLPDSDYLEPEQFQAMYEELEERAAEIYKAAELHHGTEEDLSRQQFEERKIEQ